jgi:hypothetical protein
MSSYRNRWRAIGFGMALWAEDFQQMRESMTGIQKVPIGAGNRTRYLAFPLFGDHIPEPSPRQAERAK